MVLAYHGTGLHNLRSISQIGLDPNLGDDGFPSVNFTTSLENAISYSPITDDGTGLIVVLDTAKLALETDVIEHDVPHYVKFKHTSPSIVALVEVHWNPNSGNRFRIIQAGDHKYLTQIKRDFQKEGFMEMDRPSALLRSTAIRLLHKK